MRIAELTEARKLAETQRERSDLAAALEEAESERDGARAALEARDGEVHRLGARVTELEGGCTTRLSRYNPERETESYLAGSSSGASLRIAKRQAHPNIADAPPL